MNSLKVLEYMRIKDWLYVIGIAFLGYFYEIKSLDMSRFICLFFISMFYVSHGYILNNYFDLQVEKNGLESNLNILVIISILLLSFNLIITFFYFKKLLIFVIIGAIVSFLYSSSFTRLKDIPIFNIVANSTGFTVLFIIGYIINKPFSMNLVYLSGYIWLGIIPSQIIHLMAHRKKEKNWPFSKTESLYLFYGTQILWLCWTFIALFIIGSTNYVFVLTLLFCISQSILIWYFKYKGVRDPFLKVRNKFKILHIFYGILLLLFLIV